MRSTVSLWGAWTIGITVGLLFFALTLFAYGRPLSNGVLRGGVFPNNGAPRFIAGTVLGSSQRIGDRGLVRVGLPVRLLIPRINVSALFESVGMTPDGAMDVPKDQDNVAWYNGGPRPGENGSAVLTGHYGWKNKRGSVFDELYKLRKGDVVSVADDQDRVHSFVVRELRRFAPDADALDIFVSDDGQVHLNLISCEGDWNPATKSYSRRLVVFTDKE